MEQVKLTRGELFELVWSTPMTKLAARFGLSNVGLTKICERFQIPRPPQGHWARLAWNHKPGRPSLPEAPAGVPDVIVFGAHAARTPGGDRDGVVSDPGVPVVTVSEKLTAPHAVTTYLSNGAKGAEVDKFGRLLVGLSFRPELCVRRTNLQRALTLLDALFRALTERGHAVEMKPWGLPPSPDLTVTVAERGALHIRVEEKLANTPHVPTADERDKQLRWGWKIRKYDQVPDGELIFKVEGANWQYKGRKSWSDTKRQRMEHLLGRVILTIEDIAAFNHAENVELEEKHRVAEDQRRRQLRSERLPQWRQWLAKDLEQMSADWATARRVREFLDAYERTVQNKAERAGSDADWLTAARQFADRLDPLSSLERVPKDLEPSDGILAEFAEREEDLAASVERDPPRR